ncbi:hypothetical protein GCM10027062_33670 [Nocardioides hungaricus]
MVTTLRRRGYCFASLGTDGAPVPPVPLATIGAERSRIREGERVRLTVRLDRPTSRAVRVRTTAGAVTIPRGQRSAGLWFRARQDRVDEAVEERGFEVTGGRGVRPGRSTQAQVRVRDDDPPPVVSIGDTTVTASPLLAVPARIGVRLDRPSDRPTRVVVRSDLGRMLVTVPPRSTRATGTLTVPVGRPAQDVREVALRAGGATAALTIRPPDQTWLQAARAAVAQVRWPDARLPRLF